MHLDRDFDGRHNAAILAGWLKAPMGRRLQSRALQLKHILGDSAGEHGIRH